MPRRTASTPHDATDWAILSQLAADARQTNQDIAAKVGLSPAACLRRVRALEKAGLILGYHARLNLAQLGLAVSALVFVRLASQSAADIAAFEARAAGWASVRQCTLLLGEADFLLLCAAPDMAGLQAFIARDLTAAANVDGVKVAVVLRETKHEAGLPPG